MYLAHYTKRFIPEFDAECRIEVNKDEEIAALSRKVDSLESANTELQRENIRLEKKLSIKGV